MVSNYFGFRTPLKNYFEKGGRDKEGEALGTGEPTLPCCVVCLGNKDWFIKMFQVPLRSLFLQHDFEYGGAHLDLEQK